MISKILKKLGLSDNETTLYMATLRTGIARVTTIANRADVSRSTAYNILHALKKKGFVKLINKGGIQYFSPIEPKNIVDILKAREEKLHEKMKTVEQYLPQLEAMSNPNVNIPIVSFYEGTDGIKQIYRSILKSKNKKTYAAISLDNILPEIKDWLINTFTPKKIKKKIESDILLSSKKPKSYLKLDKKHLRKTTLIPNKDYPFEVEIDVFDDNKTAFISFNETELFGVIIESEKIAKSMKTLFELAKSRK